MQLTVDFLAGSRVVLVRVAGHVDHGDILRALKALYDDPRWSPTHTALWDVRDLSGLILGGAEVEAILAFVRSRTGSIAVSGVLVKSFITEFIAVLFSRRLRDAIPRIGVFKSSAEAAAWAQLPRELLESAEGELAI